MSDYAQQEQSFHSFKEFYPYYLAEHSNANCRRMHYFGSILVLVAAAYFIVNGLWWGFLLLPVMGYGPAWFGHFVFEKNKPATFKYPVYSLIGDWVMLKDMLVGKIRF